jgi:hypothetical protein
LRVLIREISIKIELPGSREFHEALSVDDYSTREVSLSSDWKEERVLYTIRLRPERLGEAKGIINEILRLLQMLELLEK